MKIICVKAPSYASRCALLDPKYTLLFSGRDVRGGPKQMPSDLDITYIMLLEDDDKSIEYRTPDGKIHIIGYQKNLKGLETLIKEAPILAKGGILSRHEEPEIPIVPEPEVPVIALAPSGEASEDSDASIPMTFAGALTTVSHGHESDDFI